MAEPWEVELGLKLYKATDSGHIDRIYYHRMMVCTQKGGDTFNPNVVRMGFEHVLTWAGVATI